MRTSLSRKRSVNRDKEDNGKGKKSRNDVSKEERKEDVAKIILTASGGPFRGKSKAELLEVTKEQALNHPNWDMGQKITIDSATLMNKGLEVMSRLAHLPVAKVPT